MANKLGCEMFFHGTADLFFKKKQNHILHGTEEVVHQKYLFFLQLLYEVPTEIVSRVTHEDRSKSPTVHCTCPSVTMPNKFSPMAL
jgi:hypothetical protein